MNRWGEMWKNVSFCSPEKFMSLHDSCVHYFFLVRVGIGDEAPLAFSWFYIVIKSSWKLLEKNSWLNTPLLWGHFFHRCFFFQSWWEVPLCNRWFLQIKARSHSMNVQKHNIILTLWLGDNFRMVQI